ncbi:hypothetical protein D9N18_02030 [Lactococcus raffinolactis]|uniref:hypothetical protein n=1 Tax=Pseudolactococcus raffinolactis TaxID=1366 RepID=UPI001C6FDA8C|nr:hypothetical protein [Lactococcus raffinolactis]MBW9330144.1 hypothetical protein [Lactococcus raffinolactis]
MSKRDDVKKYYEWSSTIQRIVSYSFVINTFSAFLLLVISEKLLVVCVIIQLVAIFLNIVLNWVDDTIIFPNAEKSRRKVNIDNSFGINTTMDKTDGYYNNELDPSIEKLILNNFENIYFTMNIAKKMVFKEVIKTLIALIVLIIVFNLFSGTEIILLVFQIVFSGSYLLGLASFLIYFCQVKELYENFYQSLITENYYSEKLIIRLLGLSVEYEIIKGSHRIKLSTKIFNQLNSTLSQSWDELQKESLFYKKKR